MKSSEPAWRPGSPTAPPDPGVIEVWRISLEADDAELARMRSVLDPAELDRASRFRTEDLRRRFIAGRWARRALLAPMVGVEPAELRFIENAFGKPALAGDAALHFNCSASGEVGLIAVRSDAPVGVDIEACDPALADRSTAGGFMTPTELAHFDMLAGTTRLGAFFRCWTRKEAVLKCDGRGLSLDPRGVEVGAGDEPTRGGTPGNRVRIVDFRVAGALFGAGATSDPVREWRFRAPA